MPVWSCSLPGGHGGRLRLVLPPQHTAEEVRSLHDPSAGSPWRALLSGASLLEFVVPADADDIVLTASGVLAASRNFRLGPATTLEVPWGVLLSPHPLSADEELVSRHPVEPRLSDVNALWRAAVVPMPRGLVDELASGLPVALQRERPFGLVAVDRSADGAEDPFPLPLSRSDRGDIMRSATPQRPAIAGQCVWQQSGEVTGFEFSPDGSNLAVTDAGRLRVYDVGRLTAENWGETQHWPVDGTVDVVSASTVPLDQQFDSTVVIAGGRGAAGGGLEFHQVVGGGPTTFSQPATPVVGVTFSPDQELYAVWRSAGVKPLRARRRTGAVRCDWDTPPPSGVAFVSPASVVVVTGRNVVRRWDVSSPLPEVEKQLASAVEHVVLAGNTGMVAVAGGSRTWLLDSGTLEPRWFTDHVGDVSALSADPVGAVIVAHGDGVTVIQADELEATGPVAPLPATALRQLSPGVAVDSAVSSADRSLLAVTAGNSVGILDGVAGATRFKWQFDYPVVKAVFNPRDAVVVIATQEPLLVMRDVIDGDEFWWTRPPNAIQDIAFSNRKSPDMEPLLFVAGDSGVRMYERFRRG